MMCKIILWPLPTCAYMCGYIHKKCSTAESCVCWVPLAGGCVWVAGRLRTRSSSVCYDGTVLLSGGQVAASVVLSSLVSLSFYYSLRKNSGSIGHIVPFTVKGSKLVWLPCHQLHQRLEYWFFQLTDFLVICICSKLLRALKILTLIKIVFLTFNISIGKYNGFQFS